MTGLGGLKVPASGGVVALIALILSGCAETSPQSTSALAVLPSGTPGAVVPIEPQPEFWPCGAEHPQPGRLVRFDPVDGTVAWDVDVPVQVETLAMSEGVLHLSDGVGLDIVVDHTTGAPTFPEAATDSRTRYRAALPDGEGVDDETAAVLASNDAIFDVDRVVDAARIDDDLVVLELDPGADCA